MRLPEQPGDTGSVIEPLVILLEDDAELRSVVSGGLREEGFEVTAAATAGEFLRLIGDSDPDALVVDIGLPDADGRDVVQALRAHGVGAPVIFLTARDALPDRLSGFAAGGDDYLTKPFAFAELVVRLRALIRRGGSALGVEAGGLRLDPATHRASCGERAIDLTPTEFRILARLAGSAGRRGPPARARAGRVAARRDRPRQHARRLHRPDPPEARVAARSRPAIATVHGVGYSLR